MKLLHIDSSITGDHSVSRKLSAAIVDRLAATNAGLEIVRRDVAMDPIAHLTLDQMPGDAPESRVVLDEFLTSDIVVIGAPMYNFTIPSQLKAWIDRILVRGETFSYGETGPVGLAGGKRVIIGISRGGIYSAGSPASALEHLETYLRGVFGFIGIDPEIVLAEGLLLGPDAHAASMAGALDSVEALAA